MIGGVECIGSSSEASGAELATGKVNISYKI